MTDMPGENAKTPPPPENATPTGNNGAVQADTGAPPLETQLAEAQSKAAEYLEGLKRERAEFANFRKRAEKEREEVHQLGTLDTLKRLFPIIDDFDRAIDSIPPEMVDKDLIKGFTLIHRKMMSLLENAGVKTINPQGEPFDPAFHEALGHDETASVPSGHVSAVLQKGYQYGDRVIRPALVRVAN